jgi:hypothetical protein
MNQSTKRLRENPGIYFISYILYETYENLYKFESFCQDKLNPDFFRNKIHQYYQLVAPIFETVPLVWSMFC